MEPPESSSLGTGPPPPPSPGQCSNNSCRKKGPLPSCVCFIREAGRALSEGRQKLAFATFLPLLFLRGKGEETVPRSLGPTAFLPATTCREWCLQSQTRNAEERKGTGRREGGAEAAANPRDWKTDSDQQAVSPTTPVPPAAHRHKPEGSKFRLSWRK